MSTNSVTKQDWLVSAHSGIEVSTLAGKLSIDYKRAERLYTAAKGAAK